MKLFFPRPAFGSSSHSPHCWVGQPHVAPVPLSQTCSVCELSGVSYPGWGERPALPLTATHATSQWYWLFRWFDQKAFIYSKLNLSLSLHKGPFKVSVPPPCMHLLFLSLWANRSIPNYRSFYRDEADFAIPQSVKILLRLCFMIQCPAMPSFVLGEN